MHFFTTRNLNCTNTNRKETNICFSIFKMWLQVMIRQRKGSVTRTKYYNNRVPLFFIVVLIWHARFVVNFCCSTPVGVSCFRPFVCSLSHLLLDVIIKNRFCNGLNRVDIFCISRDTAIKPPSNKSRIFTEKIKNVNALYFRDCSCYMSKANQCVSEPFLTWLSRKVCMVQATNCAI